MIVEWSDRALLDLERMVDFLIDKDPDAARRVGETLFAAPDQLIGTPRLGPRLTDYAPREVRKLIVGHYELRYELRRGEIEILAIWHQRENRGIGPGS